MEITLFVVSVLLITALAWGLKEVIGVKICPVCAGVSLTWLWIIGGIYFGVLDPDQWVFIAAIAMGGSVVGAAYQLEKQLSEAAYWRTPLLWKTLFVPSGFVAVYSFWNGLPEVFLGALTAWLALIKLFIFRRRTPFPLSGHNDASLRSLEKKLGECC